MIEILSWYFPSHRRSKRQEWWDNMLTKFPEVKEYVGETKETDHPEKMPNELLFKIGKFILKKEGKESVYEDIKYEEYKEFENRESNSPVLVMKGINVDPQEEFEEFQQSLQNST